MRTVAPATEQQTALEAPARREFPPTRHPHLYTSEEIDAVQRERLTGDLRRDAATLEAILLAYRIEVCHDVRSHRTYWRRAGETMWTASTDRYTADLRERIAAEHRAANGAPLAYGDDTWRRSLNALLHHRERDLFADWLDTLPPWDGAHRLSTWLFEAFDIHHDDDDRLIRWASSYPLVAAVQRTFQPGSKIDEHPVLIGPQGCGKSTAVRLLLPPTEAARYGWFSDSLNLAGDDKHRAEALQGRVIVELSELQGGTRAELDSLKAFLSRTDDGTVRLAYRRDPEPAPRRAVMVGTSNPTPTGELPNDVTGLRRFVAIRITAGDPQHVRAYLDEHRLQLWAEAVHAHAHGARAHLPNHLEAAQTATNEQHRRRDTILEDELLAWLGEQTQPFSLVEAARGLGLANGRAATLDKRTTARLSRALKACGYERHRELHNRTRRHVWRPDSGSGGSDGSVLQ